MSEARTRRLAEEVVVVVGMEVAAGVCSGVGLRVLGGRGGFCMEYGLMWVWL